MIAAAVLLASATPARADLVRLRGHAGEELARRAGGTELVPELRIWRVPTTAVARLRESGVVERSQPERLLVKMRAASEAGVKAMARSAFFGRVRELFA